MQNNEFGNVIEETDDKDPTSEEEAAPNGETPFQTDSAAWSGMFFERQGADARCGMHALNNAVGRAWQTPDDMDYACEEYLRASQQEGSAETREYHVATSGW